MPTPLVIVGKFPSIPPIPKDIELVWELIILKHSVWLFMNETYPSGLVSDPKINLIFSLSEVLELVILKHSTSLFTNEK